MGTTKMFVLSRANVFLNLLGDLLYSIFMQPMHYFIKLLADGSDHRMQILLKHPLWLAILVAGAQRVWRYITPSPE